MSNPYGCRMSVGEALTVNQYIQSPDHRLKLVMQDDGNLVLYGPNSSLWSSDTAGHGAVRATLQTDGNLCLYPQDGGAVWSSDTANSGVTSQGALALQDDGNLVIYKFRDASGANAAVWGSNTHVDPDPIPGYPQYELTAVSYGNLPPALAQSTLLATATRENTTTVTQSYNVELAYTFDEETTHSLSDETAASSAYLNIMACVTNTQVSGRGSKRRSRPGCHSLAKLQLKSPL